MTRIFVSRASLTGAATIEMGTVTPRERFAHAVSSAVVVHFASSPLLVKALMFSANSSALMSMMRE